MKELTAPSYGNRAARALQLCLTLLFVASCSNMQGVNVGTSVALPGGIGVGANKTIGSGADKPKSNKPQSKAPGVKLYVFDSGSLAMDDVSPFGLSNLDTQVRELFEPCYLIEHPNNGRLLWDGGLPAALAGQGPQPLGEGQTQVYKRSLQDQLADMRLNPSDIKYVAFSHMHFDHVGSANLFTDSILIIQQSEYTAAFEKAAENPYFEHELYKDLADNTKIVVSGDHDVFGDGSVQIISAPGHTPGHQVLLVNLKNLGPVLLSGDLYHFEASRKLRAVPSFNTNKAATLESMTKIEQLLRQSDATLWIEHNKALADRPYLAPAYYD